MTDYSRTITVDMGRACRRCHKPGAANNGLCLRCIEKAILAGEFDHILRPSEGKQEEQSNGQDV